VQELGKFFPARVQKEKFFKFWEKERTSKRNFFQKKELRKGIKKKELFFVNQGTLFPFRFFLFPFFYFSFFHILDLHYGHIMLSSWVMVPATFPTVRTR